MTALFYAFVQICLCYAGKEAEAENRKKRAASDFSNATLCLLLCCVYLKIRILLISLPGVGRLCPGTYKPEEEPLSIQIA